MVIHGPKENKYLKVHKFLLFGTERAQQNIICSNSNFGAYVFLITVSMKENAVSILILSKPSSNHFILFEVSFSLPIS